MNSAEAFALRLGIAIASHERRVGRGEAVHRIVPFPRRIDQSPNDLAEPVAGDFVNDVLPPVLDELVEGFLFFGFG